jgi:predicted CopG family antitoxin
MPRAGEGRSIRIDPEVYEALLMLKRGNMTFSDVIAQMLHDCYGWSDESSASQSDLSDFVEITSDKSVKGAGSDR